MRWFAVIVAGTLFVAAPPALAQTKADADNRQAAVAQFAEGQRAFKAGDYRAAARAFESAHRLAPHPDVLWNAARAWQRAGNAVHAANLYAEYLDIAPSDALDRARATAALAELSRKLGVVEIHRVDDDAVALDDQPTDQQRVYVTPGAHAMSVSVRGGAETRSIVVNVGAGAVVSVTSRTDEAHPDPQASVTRPPEPVPAPAPEEPPRTARTPRKGWSPVVVYVGGALTLAGVALSTWAGVATLDARSDFDAKRSQDNLDHGRSLQTITNVGFAVTAGLGVVTAAAAIFLVDWRSPGGRVGLGVGPGFLSTHGTF